MAPDCDPATTRQEPQATQARLSFEALYAKLLVHCDDLGMQPTAGGALLKCTVRCFVPGRCVCIARRS